jgi:UrcA family protein
MRALAIVASATVVALASGPALAAGPEPTTAQVSVRLGDLDLNTARDAHAAIARLTRAASEACGEQPGVSPDLIRLSDAFHRCRATTLATAVTQINTAAIDVAFAEARGHVMRVAKQ